MELANLVKRLQQHAPVVAWSVSFHGRVVLQRPVEAPALQAMAAMAALTAAAVATLQERYTSAAEGLHYSELVKMCPDQQPRRIINFAVQQLLLTRRAAARVTGVHPAILAAHQRQVEVAFDQLAGVHAAVQQEMQQEVEKLSKRQAELQQELQEAGDAGYHADSVAVLQRQLAATNSKLVARSAEADPVRYKALLQLKLKQHVCHIPALRNQLRGHNPSAEVQNPDFVPRVEAAAQHLSGRTSKRRDSTAIIFSHEKSTWRQLAKLVGDPEFMAGQGGAINISHSALKTLTKMKVLQLSARKRW
ncbi:hypothetical protein COO60DRAFT_712760 [Scenedesmus sp. NREL 46B-D3]|nr:hypothetical protein COO60DRAFT_712760 [Scenedesmus sp. NREL 46B-D3]